LPAELRRQLREALFVNGRIVAGLRKLVTSESADPSVPKLVFGDGADPVVRG
jgi:hypothetical protein